MANALRRLGYLFAVLILLQTARAEAALGPSLARQTSGPERDLDVIVLLASGQAQPAPAASSRAAAYFASRPLLQNQNEQLVADFLANARRAGITLGLDRSFWLAPFVSATVSSDDLALLADLPGVAAVIENTSVDLVAPVMTPVAPTAADATATGLAAIGATAAWQQGITGKGSLVASLDTGVDGTHPALAARYRGLQQAASASWLDPFANDFPNDPVGHGTHTMGTVLGREDGDTVGVAPDAEWIAAGVVDRGRTFSQTIADLLAAFEWLADPDLNPATTTDLPDVALNSWGIPQGIMPACDETFWTVVDNLEALGVVVIFAAGNEGPEASTLRLPADRGDQPLRCFAVGAVDGAAWNLGAAPFSSRGPVSCNSLIIKPEIVAPGVAIRSCEPGGGYQLLSGTSMAAPHVAGAVALMRQFNPDATPAQIKQALIESALDLGEPGPDFATGYGLLNIAGALALLPTPAPLKWEWNVPVVQIPGEEVVDQAPQALDILMYNRGRSVEGMQIELSTLNSALQPDGPLTLTVDHLAASDGLLDIPFTLPSASAENRGDRIWIKLDITATLPVLDTTVILGVPVGSLPQRTALAQTAGNLTTVASNFGRFDAETAQTLSVNAAEFTYAGRALTFSGGLSLHAAGVDRTSYGPENPFEPAPDGLLRAGDSELLSITALRDTRLADPLGVELTQEVFAAVAGAGDYLLYRYRWERLWAEQEPLRCGAWFHWNVPGTDRLEDVSEIPGALAIEADGVFLGAVFLGGAATAAVMTFDSALAQLPAPGASLPAPAAQADAYVLTLTGEARSAASGEFAVVLVAAASRADWLAAAHRAVAQYAALAGADDGQRPEAFELLPSYPNPFNPATTIHYRLERAADVRVDLFNLLGQRVRTLAAQHQEAGEHRLKWDATTDRGQTLPSGVYLIRVQSEDHVVTSRVTLLR